MKLILPAKLFLQGRDPDQTEFEVQGENLREAIEDLSKTFPIFLRCLRDNKLTIIAAWYINGIESRTLQGADTLLSPEDVIQFSPMTSWPGYN